MQPVHPRQACTLAANEHCKKARGGLDEEPLADINTHIHKLSSVLESLVVDLLNQRAQKLEAPQALVSKFDFCITVDVW